MSIGMSSTASARMALLALVVGWSGLPGTAASQTAVAGGLAAWGDSLPLDSRVSRELHRYESEIEFGPDLTMGFVEEVRSRVISSAAVHSERILSDRCAPFVDVTIGDEEFPALEEVAKGSGARGPWKEFQKSLIRTEMVACLTTDLGPGEVLQLYIGPEFRMGAESRIIDMWEDGEGSCMETKGVRGLVDPTRICNRIHTFSSEDLAAQHSQVVFNEGVEPYQNAYYKESLKTFVRIPGGVALHYINYTRAANLGSIERWIGAGQIEDSQKETVEELQRWLLLRSQGKPEEATDPNPHPETPGWPRPGPEGQVQD